MRCRRVKRDFTKNIIVWFGSYGVNQDGTAKFYNINDKHDNISSNQDGVADSLLQRLSVIEGELWYSINEGLPLLTKINSKIELDALISGIILSHPDVIDITSLSSEIVNKHTYSSSIVIETIYGQLELVI